MEREQVDELFTLARTVAATGDPSPAEQRLGAALATTDDPATRGELHLALAIALQCVDDPQRPAEAAMAAVDELRQAGGSGKRAYATAVAAVFQQRAGNLGRAVDLAVEVLVLLPDVAQDGDDRLAAVNAISQVFAEMGDFTAAVELAEANYRLHEDLPRELRGHASYAVGWCAVEGLRQHGVEGNERWLALALEMADYQRGDTVSPIPPRIVATGLEGEVHLVRDDEAAFAALADLDLHSADDHPLYAETGPRLVAWHQLVRACGARRWGEAGVAARLLDQAVPALTRLGDRHRLDRARREHALVRAACGDHEGALQEALALAHRSRRRHVEEVGDLLAHLRDRAELERAGAVLRRRADDLARTLERDEVTGVHTRRHLEMRLDQLADGSGTLTIVIADIDRFKTVNDLHGHQVGDAVLAHVGRVLSYAGRDADIVARYGGDEFVILLPGAPLQRGREVAARANERLHSVATAPLAGDLTVTMSMGIATGRAANARVVLRAADTALYEAKHAGRDRIVAAS